MKTILTLIFLSVFCLNAINAEVTWSLSEDSTLTISGTDMPNNRDYDDAPWYRQHDKIKNVIIENGVTSIGSYAFSYCNKLTSITVPNSVRYIGSYAFYGCSGLTSVTIPNSVTSIGAGAFYGCSGLTSITIPNSVTSISPLTLLGCNNLTSIIVEKGNKKYDSRNNCNAIIETESNTLVCGFKNTVIPNSVTSIGSSAFYECRSLTSITIPNSVTSIGYSAFQYCSSLTSITIPNSVTSIGYSAFQDCSSLTSITIPNSVTSIGYSAFQDCSSLTSITIPNSLISISSSAFYECSSLTSVTIPNSVISIGSSAFYGCINLKNATIGKSIEIIGNNAFKNCYNLQSIIINNPEPPACEGVSTFTCSTKVRDQYDVYTYATIHVPMGSKEAYSSAYEWRYFNKIKEDMELDGKVYYAKLAVKQGTTGYTEQPVKADETYTIYIGALNNSKINAVTFNGEDVTNQVKDGYYTTPEIKAKSILSISYEDISTTNVKEISNPELKVTGNDGEINISGIDSPTNVEVYTTDGKLVESKGSVYGDTSIQVKEDELYLIKVGKRAIKIAM